MALRLSVLSLLALFAAHLAILASPASAFDLGLAWGADQNWAKELSSNHRIAYYHTWQARHVASLSKSGVQWVPMRWGYSKGEQWPAIKKLFPKYRYPYALAYNEPDISTQSNYSPGGAAKAFQKELAPLRQYGTKISSPQICYDVDWLSKFMKSLHKKGGRVDFLAVHYYGSWNSLHKLKNYINNVHNKFPNQKIWVTEYGVTSSSNPSAAQAKHFMVEATKFFASTGYVDVAFPFGMFANPPDSFGSRQNAAFRSSGKLRSLGQYYKHYGNARRSMESGELKGSVLRRHERLLQRLERPDPEDEELWDNHPNHTDCDEVCQKRDSWLQTTDDKPWSPSENGDDDSDDDDSDDDDAKFGIDSFTEEDAKASHDGEEDESDSHGDEE